MKSQMHGRDMQILGGTQLQSLAASGEAKTRDTLDTVFKMPTFYYHHGKKLRQDYKIKDLLG